MRSATSPTGRAGMILPTGIAVDKPTRYLFNDLVERESIVSLYDFENKYNVFPAVHSGKRFCLLTLTGSSAPATEPTFVFLARDIADLDDPNKRFILTSEDFILLNPNTRTTPTFSNARDAEITTDVYRRQPILLREGDPGGNIWDITPSTMFHSANDSALFAPPTNSKKLDGSFKETSSPKLTGVYLPLYEAKMAGFHDHRAADVVISPTAKQRPHQPRYIPPSEKVDPNRFPMPIYWVSDTHVVANARTSRKC